MEEEERDLESYRTPTGYAPTCTELNKAFEQYDNEMASDNDLSMREFLDQFFSREEGSGLDCDDVLDGVSEDLERSLANEDHEELSHDFNSKLSLKSASSGVPELHEIDSPFFEKENTPAVEESLDPMDAGGLISSTSESIFRRTLYNFIIKMMYSSTREDVFSQRGGEIGNSIASNFLDRKGAKRDRYYMAAAYFIGSMYNQMPQATSKKKESRQLFRIVGSSEGLVSSFKTMISYSEGKGSRIDIEAYGAEQARRLYDDNGGLSGEFVRGYQRLLNEIGLAIMRRNTSTEVRQAFETEGFTMEENMRSSAPKPEALESREDEEKKIREIFGGTAVDLLTNTDKGTRIRSRGADRFSLLIPNASACPLAYRRYLASADRQTRLGIVEHHLFEGHLSLRSDNHSLCSLANKQYSLIHGASSDRALLESHASIEGAHQLLENRFLDNDEEDDATVEDEETVEISSSKKKIQIKEDEALSIRVFFIDRLLD